MKDTDVILNAIASKNIFEYLLINKNFEVAYFSEGIHQYLENDIKIKDNILNFFFEFIGIEEIISNTFASPHASYALHSLEKNNYYTDIYIEYYSSDKVLILLHNVTDEIISKQRLLQSSNEAVLMSHTLQKVLDKQNVLLFITNKERITYANRQFLDYFSMDSIETINNDTLQLFGYKDNDIHKYSSLFNKVNNKEEYITIDSDTFILKASLVEEVHKVFTLVKVTDLSNKLYCDPLTLAYKKEYFTQKIQEYLDDKVNIFLVSFSLNNIRSIYNQYGNEVGDTILKEFSILLKENIASTDLFSRWNEEEFIILIKSTSISEVKRKIEYLSKILKEYKFSKITSLTFCVGIAYSSSSDTIESILLRTDSALYESQESDENKIVLKLLKSQIEH